jgi:DNA-binding transcriptional ArsR family regulator
VQEAADLVLGVHRARPLLEAADQDHRLEPLAALVRDHGGYVPTTCRRKRKSYSAPIGSLSATLDGTFFALSDPTRREILERLGRGPATISELAQPFGLTLNGVKKHVGILERADLVTTEKVGRARQCRLGSADLAPATEWIEAHRQVWEQRIDRFQRYVEEAP